jgi:hypothetical protein
MNIKHVLGLDLGQAQDFTAVVVVERQWHEEADKRQLHIRHLHRFPLGVSYPAMVEELTAMAQRSPLDKAEIVVDATGVGKPVVDMFRCGPLSGRIVPVLITAGHEVTKAEDGTWHLPKKELVGVLQVLFGAQRLHVAPGLKHGEALKKELLAFKAKPTAAGSTTFEAWRERDHDDLVLATALACWQACQVDPWESYVPPKLTSDDRPEAWKRMGWNFDDPTPRW